MSYPGHCTPQLPRSLIAASADSSTFSSQTASDSLSLVPLLSLFIFAKLTAPYNEHFHYLRLTAGFLIVIPPFLLSFFYFELAGSRVCLFYHQEKSKTARADIKRYLEWLGFTVFGIIIAWLWHKFFG